MKRQIFLMTLAILACGLGTLVHSNALAAGTASGTSIDNQATVDYEVGGIAQTTVNSNTATFVVDNKVDLTVATTDVAAVAVIPGSADNVLTFTVTNEGNTVQDYSLAAQAAAGTLFGVTDNFDATNVAVFVDVNDNDSYEPATDTATYIDELAADGAITVFILGDVPLAQEDGDGALYDLIAQTAAGGTSSTQGADITTDDAGEADDSTAVQIVFADGAGTADAAEDGKHSSRDAYEVVTATLSVVKDEDVISDPINGGTNPKAIPGATIRYTITVTNGGSDDADAIVFVDDIPTNTSYTAGTITLNSTAKTDADDADEADYNVTNAGAVTVSVGTLAASGGSATITFDVTVD